MTSVHRRPCTGILRFAQTDSTTKLFLASMEQRKQSHTEDINAFEYLDWLSVEIFFSAGPPDIFSTSNMMSGPELFPFTIVSAQFFLGN